METMSKLLLIRSAMISPLHGETDAQRSLMAVHLKVNTGSAKVNHITCRNILTRKLDLKLPQTQLWDLLKGSLNLQSQYRSSRGFAVRAEAAAGFPVSYESSETDNGGEKKLVNSGINLSDVGKNVKGFEVRQIEGSDIGDGNNNQGGHGNGGNSGGGDTNNNSGGYGGLGGSDDSLLNIAWWWLLQGLRMLRTSSAMWGGGSPELVWLVEKAFQFLTVDLMMSTGMTRSLMLPSVLAIAELSVILSGLLACFMIELECFFTVVFAVMLGGFVTVAAGLSWAALSLSSLWLDSSELPEVHDIENDYCGEE